MILRGPTRRLIEPLREQMAGIAGWYRLQTVAGQLSGKYYEQREPVEKLLRSSYESYTRNVSSSRSAVSFETACFMYCWCEIYRPLFILDLGSGYSSYVFRLYQQRSGNDVRVVSVDDSTEWLEATRHYLAGHGLAQDGLLTVDGFTQLTPERTDLVFLDIRPLQRRIDLLPGLFNALSDGGAIVVDDMHKPHFRPGMISAASTASGRFISLRRLTLDQYGRYSYLLIKAPATGHDAVQVASRAAINGAESTNSKSGT